MLLLQYLIKRYKIILEYFKINNPRQVMATHKVIHVFSGQGNQMLPVQIGELVTICNTSADNRWCTVKKGDSVGLVPSTHLEPLLDNDTAVSDNGECQYIVLYDYDGGQPQQLPIKTGDKLLLIERHTKDWWTMKNTLTHKTGMVPTSYIKQDIQQQSKEAKNEVLLSIDRAIEKIHNDAGIAGGHYTVQQRTTLKTLVAHRQSVVKGDTVAMETSVTKEVSPPVSMDTHISPRRKPPPPPGDSTSVPSNSSTVPSNNDTGVESLDLAGVQLRDRQQKIRGIRPQSEIIVKRPAPPPPSRTVSLKPNETPPIKTTPTEAPPTETPATNKDRDSREGSIDSSASSSDEPVVGSISPNTKKRLASYLTRVNEVSYSTELNTVHENITLPTEFNNDTATDMIDVIRNKSGANYYKSALALEGLLQYMEEHIPVLEPVMNGLLNALHTSQATGQGDSNEKEGVESEDMKRLKDILFEIREARDDSQQRGWAIRDDSHDISQYLEELLQLLYDADSSTSRTVLQEDKYEHILVLISYYQLETRSSLRILLLRIFGACCTLDQTIISIMLQSVLPNELGHDIRVNTKDIYKTYLSSVVCTMMFSTGEEVPLSVYDQWNVEYILFLLQCIEDTITEDDEEELPDAFLNVLLSFNQHFEYPSTNTLMEALKQCDNPRVFSEKLMLLVNRGEDPVCIEKPCCPDSLTKILLDIFSDNITANIFYTTDLKVLIDIISRQLNDLCPGDKTRSQYIELFQRLISTTSYSEHYHRRSDISVCLKRILREEGQESKNDHTAIQALYTKFPGMFND